MDLQSLLQAVIQNIGLQKIPQSLATMVGRVLGVKQFKISHCHIMFGLGLNIAIIRLNLRSLPIRPKMELAGRRLLLNQYGYIMVVQQSLIINGSVNSLTIAALP